MPYSFTTHVATPNPNQALHLETTAHLPSRSYGTAAMFLFLFTTAHLPSCLITGHALNPNLDNCAILMVHIARMVSYFLIEHVKAMHLHHSHHTS